MRLREDLQDGHLSPKAGQLDRVAMTQVLEDSHARQRRLSELLLLLVLFSQSNEQEHYRHLLLLEELDELLSANEDRSEFYGAPSENVRDSIEHQVSWIKQIQERLDLGRAWYMVDGLDVARIDRLRAGRILSSQRQRLRKALPLMTSGERLQMGLSCAASYGRISETIHYTANRHDVFLPEDDAQMGGMGLGLHSLSILSRSYELLGRPDLLIAQKIADALRRSAADDLVARASRRHVAVGEVVVAAGDLAEVLAVLESEYGLVSYRVRYLAERPKSEVAEDWFPS